MTNEFLHTVIHPLEGLSMEQVLFDLRKLSEEQLKSPVMYLCIDTGTLFVNLDTTYQDLSDDLWNEYGSGYEYCIMEDILVFVKLFDKSYEVLSIIQKKTLTKKLGDEFTSKLGAIEFPENHPILVIQTGKDVDFPTDYENTGIIVVR